MINIMLFWLPLYFHKKQPDFLNRGLEFLLNLYVDEKQFIHANRKMYVFDRFSGNMHNAYMSLSFNIREQFKELDKFFCLQRFTL